MEKRVENPEVSAEREKVKLHRALACPEKTARHCLSQGSSSASRCVRHLNARLENGPLCSHRAETLEKHQPEQLSCFTLSPRFRAGTQSDGAVTRTRLLLRHKKPHIGLTEKAAKNIALRIHQRDKTSRTLLLTSAKFACTTYALAHLHFKASQTRYLTQ